MSLPTGARLGPYEVVSHLGSGGMGEVYRAHDSKLKRDVAIKVLPSEFVQDKERLARFEREAQLLAQLNHPNIAHIYGMEASGDSHALVMELVEGPTLADRLAQGPLPLDEALSLARQIAEALEEAHEKGIVHRDLKPQNVKASIEGKAKVLDFGLAKAMDASAGSVSGGGGVGGGGGAGGGGDLLRSPTLMNSPTLTAAHGTQLGVILGTAAYMAPEQAKGRAVDRRGDIWAFGVVLFEMVTGRRLFEGETVSETIAAVLRQEIDWGLLPDDAPAALRALLERCLDRDPRTRLRDIGEARLALDRLQRGESAGSAPGTAMPAARHARREVAGWVVAIVVALLSAGLWIARGSGARPLSESRVVRSVLPLPRGVTIELDGERAGMPELSHDGRRIAFGAREGAGATRIWVLDLETGHARALPGTEEGYRPFWSPDDRQLGFFTWSHLSTTPVEGGAVRRLARARDARGGSWNRAGTILFAPHQYGALLTIPAGGGETSVATDLPGGPRSGTHRFPHFLPDGERFLYLERASLYRPGMNAGVAVGRLGAKGPARRLLDLATNVRFADGRLLFVRDGTLMAQSFDPDALALSGEARPVLGDLLYNQRFTYGVFSTAEGGLLACLTGHQSDRSQLVWRDRAGRRLGELGTPGALTGLGGLAISPDGRWAAVSRVEDGTSEADLWLYDLSRGTETRLARPGTDDFAPLFAPDSRALYYGSQTNETSKGRVIRRDLGTGAETELLSRGGRYVAPTSIPRDGSFLVYDLGDEESLGINDIVAHPLGGSGAERTLASTAGDDLFGQISPDGRWLAWASDESGQYQVYVAPLPGPGTPVQVSRAGGTQPRWNPLGGELFFKTPDNMLTAVPVESGSGTFSVGAPQPLFQIVEFLGWTYDVAPDGQRFLVREPLNEGDVSPITLLSGWPALVERR